MNKTELRELIREVVQEVLDERLGDLKAEEDAQLEGKVIEVIKERLSLQGERPYDRPSARLVLLVPDPYKPPISGTTYEHELGDVRLDYEPRTSSRDW